MKSIVIGVSLVLVGLFVVLTALSVHARTIRMVKEQTALENTVESAVDDALSQNLFTQKSQEEFVAEFLENALVQLNPDATVTVDIAAADLDKGILSVKVTQQYESLGQKKRTLSYETTALLERDGEKEYFSIIFQDEDGTSYRKYKIAQGENIILPNEAPSHEGKKFCFWESEEGVKATSRTVANKDVTYIAKYQ
ncbi:MAG: hypothetical protein K6G01_05455 [Eubacterium sp.]|nr:hypothetical protein [Eubacterium sp.]